MQLLTPAHWQAYELLDSGGFEKLERFDRYVLCRPEPQAVWDKSLPDAEWAARADATFRKEKSNPEKGQWERRPGVADKWRIGYQHGSLDLTFKLSLSAFRHVGLFPEQATNWDYLAAHLAGRGPAGPRPAAVPADVPPRVLNLFAYTGGASLAARQLGADVVHVDAVKQVVGWARENMEASHLANVRWVVEDALKFARREVRRGSVYQGIILDPPAYGRGPDGEKWVLEENINELLKLCAQLLDPDRHFFILNLYSLGFSALIVENLLRGSFPNLPPMGLEVGELYLPDGFGKRLPLGVFGRFAKP